MKFSSVSTTRNRVIMANVMAWLLIGVTALSTACSKEKGTEAGGKPQQAATGDHGYKYKIIVQDMEFNWRPSGDTLQLMIRAKTKGWVGVGFNATEGMKDAWFIMGFVQNGKATVTEQHGNSLTTHREKLDLGGTSSVTNATGTEQNNVTEIRFTIPIRPAGTVDKPLNVTGDTVVLLAYGKSKQIAQLHAFRAKVTVNLSTGNYSIIPTE